jgi:TRAP-type C4-dicarboxylate transport system substrate-binding protein
VAAALGTFHHRRDRAGRLQGRIPHVAGARHRLPLGQGRQDLGRPGEGAHQGRINIKLYPGVSLIQGDQTREFSALRQGVIDMAVGSTINWSPQVKELNLFSLPFLMPDYAAIDALTQGEVGKKISPRWTRPAWCRWPGAKTATAS